MKIIHQVFGSMLKIKYLSNVTFDAVALWIDILASIADAVRCSYHSMLQATPGKLIFGHDMLLYTNFQLNYREMWLRKKKASIIIMSVKTQSKWHTPMSSSTTRTL